MKSIAVVFLTLLASTAAFASSRFDGNYYCGPSEGFERLTLQNCWRWYEGAGRPLNELECDVSINGVPSSKKVNPNYNQLLHENPHGPVQAYREVSWKGPDGVLHSIDLEIFVTDRSDIVAHVSPASDHIFDGFDAYCSKE